jgi:hypothetical protein
LAACFSGYIWPVASAYDELTYYVSYDFGPDLGSAFKLTNFITDASKYVSPKSLIII